MEYKNGTEDTIRRAGTDTQNQRTTCGHREGKKGTTGDGHFPPALSL